MWTLKDIANRYDNVHVMKPIDTTPVPMEIWKVLFFAAIKTGWCV